jgi:hypothetical protein
MFALALRSGLALAVILPLSGGREPVRVPSDRHTMTGFTTEQEAAIDWAVGLFDEAGLALPGIAFVRDSTVDPCHGQRGWFEPQHEGPVVHVCIHDGGTIGDHLILHEIAHAWNSHNLDGDRRAEFLQWRGLVQWSGQDRDEWIEYGSEQAAEVMVWGLMDRPIGALQITPPYDDCAHLLAGYVLLTDQQPLHGYVDRCAR